jgi:hypothetical protein
MGRRRRGRNRDTLEDGDGKGYIAEEVRYVRGVWEVRWDGMGWCSGTESSPNMAYPGAAGHVKQSLVPYRSVEGGR